MERLAELLTQGGDARILVDPATGTNKYFASPYPRETVTYASTTANDIGAEAYNFLAQNYAHHIAAGQIDAAEYERLLAALRQQLLAAYSLNDDNDIIFAPSGTDLEFIALLAAMGTDCRPVHNILLGADEVGSGCIYSAAGQYFADETALGIAAQKAHPVAGLPEISLSEIPVRDGAGTAHDSGWITRHLIETIDAALAQGHRPLVHIVHGSKTGLILPRMNDIDRLQNLYGEQIVFVVDACQARITSQALHDYLQRGIVVMMTGSKFMGGPPFNGFAICPAQIVGKMAPIPSGFADIFRRSEFPGSWAGRSVLFEGGNLGLGLRIAASLFELRRFQALAIEDIRSVIAGFHVMAEHVISAVSGTRILAHAPADARLPEIYPLEMQTMVTFDLNSAQGGDGLGQNHIIGFDTATKIHRLMTDWHVRLGQPVRCCSFGNKDYHGTLRLGLSMPQITALAELGEAERQQKFLADGEAIIAAYQKARDCSNLDHPAQIMRAIP